MTRIMKILIAVLALSLVTNIFLAGFLVGAKRHATHSAHVMDHRALRGFIRLTDEPLRSEIRKAMRDMRRDHKASFERARAIRNDIHTLMRADDLDRDALAQKFAELRAIGVELQADMERLILDSADKLSPEDRRKILDELEHRRRR